MDHPKPWLRYIDADELESPSVNFANVKVESSSGEQLGEINGFIVDARSGRPYYAAIDAGGWFKSKLFLLPIGHTAFDRTRKRLVADVTRERVNKFPGFDRREFETLSDQELQRIDEQTVIACCPTETIDRATVRSRFDRWSHYKSPDWWSADFYRPDRVDKTASSMAGAGSTPPVPQTMPPHKREAVVAQSDDVSPHAGGRAQPSDVVGVETGGERTYVGDTSEDENKRRGDAQRSARK